MNIKYVCAFFVSMLFSINIVYANTIIIDINGTGNYDSIQEGIDNSVNGDTVLVYPGTYYANINYNGRNITVASLYISTQADSFIRQTIIDGNQKGTVVSIVSGEDETALLCGFTIQNGIGFMDLGFQRGGGIVIKDSNPTIKKCIVKNNKAQYGGGLYFCNSTNATLSGITVTDNHATRFGGGINLSGSSSVNFDTDILSNVYLNYSPIGSDFSKSSSCPFAEIVVDTFTVLSPDSYFIRPIEDVTTTILHAKINPVSQDLYVSPDGDNINSGITPTEPLQTIAFALTKIASDSLQPNTIHIADGVYSPSINDEMFPLNIRSYVSLVGESMENTILDGEYVTNFLRAEDFEEQYILKNFTLINGNGNNDVVGNGLGGFSIRGNNYVFLHNITVHSCSGYNRSGIEIDYTDNLLMRNVYLHSNRGGRALALFNDGETYKHFTVENCIIKENLPDDDPEVGYGGGITLGGRMTIPDIFTGVFTNIEITSNVNNNTDWYPSSVALAVINNAQVDVINCTIGDNTTPTGGAVKLDYGAEVNIINSILYGDSPGELVVDGRDMPCTLTVQNSLIQGGMWDIMVLGNNTLNWLDGNIDDDPLWIGSGEYPYSLSYGSPCIDSGTIDTTGLHLPTYDLAGNPRIKNSRIDMGAYEYQDTVSVDPSHDHSDWLYTLQNTPNPFHEGTSILFSVHGNNHIEDMILTIYNAKGQLVKRFTSENYEFTPYTEVYWDGTDEQGKQVAPGAYFYKLEYNGHAVVRKMVLLR